MKYLMCAVLLFTLAQAIGQPMKGSNVIIVKGATFREAVEQLLARGYTVSKIDSNYRTISTEPLTIKKATASLMLSVYEKDSALTIRGRASSLMSVNVGGFEGKAENMIVENKGMKGSSMRLCFAALDDFAKSFGKEVVYKTE